MGNQPSDVKLPKIGGGEITLCHSAYRIKALVSPQIHVHTDSWYRDIGSRMKPIHSLSSEILPFFLGKVFISAAVHVFMALYLTEVTANTQQATTSLPKLNNSILSIKVMWQICYIFTWTLLKSEAPITGPEQKRLFHRHSHTQLTCVVMCMRVCPGVIMCNSGKHVDGCVYVQSFQSCLWGTVRAYVCLFCSKRMFPLQSIYLNVNWMC